MSTYRISRAFSSSVERTPRVLEVAEAFGLGLSDKRFVVYDDLLVELNQGDVVYITGQSGSGKSLLLRDLTGKLRADGKVVADLNEVELTDEPVIEQVGGSMTEGLRLLGLAGISDAWIFIRRPFELSDGQRYRVKLAKIIGSNADVWVADEFGAVLDRVTAKVIAFNVQKAARAAGRTLMVATTHTDLKDELGPSLTITKRFREKVEVEKAAV
ncbi:ATP-binding cassette domain-containing protein [Methylobacterium sp. AMS5]|uniref:ATP-binding cassette domain-containing protein n=1 Tax=Methylobacterium sp. AMS5 TaxID=925818 RepID=UPI00074FA512|nr:ATP-binding cassette domain-containing protein [Methylobacterium sp. AMS5]AMB48281.1 ABC transporter [Methylobacterium sp. AMS5]